MNNARRTGYVLRDSIVELLTDAELAKVSKAEEAVHLEEGEEFIDLLRLEEGVRRADGVLVQIGNVLPRSAVREETWARIMTLLDSPTDPELGANLKPFRAVPRSRER